MPSTVLLDIAGRRRSPATLPASHAGRPPTTTACAIRQTHPPWRRSSPSSRRWRRRRGRQTPRADRRALARRPTGQRGPRPSGERPRPKEGRSPGPAWQRRQAPRGRNGPLGLGSTGPLAHIALRASGRRAVLHPARPNPRAALGARRRPQSTPRGSRSCWSGRCFAPHQLRHAHAVEMSREGVPLLVIQRQLGHADLAITSLYLRGIDNTEIVHTVHERPAPMVPAHCRPPS